MSNHRASEETSKNRETVVCQTTVASRSAGPCVSGGNDDYSSRISSEYASALSAYFAMFFPKSRLVVWRWSFTP